MDVATSVMDEGGGSLTTKRKHMEQIALRLSEKTLADKLELADNISSALKANVAIFATPKPTTAAMDGKTAAIRTKLVHISDAQTVLTALLGELKVLETDLDATLTSEASYLVETTKDNPANLALIPVELKSHGHGTTAPGPIPNFRLSPGVNSGEVLALSDPTPGAVNYEHCQIPDITKPDVRVMLESSTGCRMVLGGFPSGAHVWISRRAAGGKKTGKGPWCAPSIVTVP